MFDTLNEVTSVPWTAEASLRELEYQFARFCPEEQAEVAAAREALREVARRVLIQEKTRVPARHEYPEKIPAFFTDIKPGNFGMVNRDGKELFVCHDYGFHLLHEKGMTKRMQKVQWGFNDED